MIEEKSTDSPVPASVAESSVVDSQVETTPVNTVVAQTVVQNVWENVVAFHRDEESGWTPQKRIDHIIGRVLGDKIATGMYVAYTGKVPRIHLLDTPVKATLEDFQKNQEALLNCITENDRVEGITPSTNALRVMFLMLRSLPDLSKNDASQLGALRKEAGRIDLKNPVDKDWEKNCTLWIGDRSLDLRLTLQKNDPLTRAGAVLLSEDIPVEQRANKFSFKVEVQNSEPLKTPLLRFLDHRKKQAEAVAYLTSPQVFVAWASAKFLPEKLLPAFTSNQALQSWAEFGADSLPFAVTGVLSYMLMRRMQKEHFGS